MARDHGSFATHYPRYYVSKETPTMNVFLESPLFPTPVRWFEIPVKNVTSGLGRLAEARAPEAADPTSEDVESSEPEVARLLDTRA